MDFPYFKKRANTPKSSDVTQQKRPEDGLSRRMFFQGAAAATATGVLAVSCADVNSSVIASSADVQTAAGGQVREYWIQADSFYHNLMPSGIDQMSGLHYQPNESSYWAIGYRAYTSDWKKPLAGDSNIGANAGIPGPVIRANVGDTIRVHFRNNDTYYKFMHSMHPHGVLYTPANDGAWTAQAATKPGTALKVGETFTYEWKAVASSVGSWPYHDHSMPMTIPGSTSSSGKEMGGVSNGIMELSAELGMFGMIVVTDSNTPPVDREILLYFHDLYEVDIPQLSQDFDCFNGYAFLGNTPNFEARVGERVRWRIMALGQDFHVFHLHGHRWSSLGTFIDSAIIGPATTLTFDYVEDNPGTWLYHCHVTEHMMGGMVGYYTVK
ncbi:MAG TPA: multicopper oxidase domain-containing protein [Ktedonobacteraceae bacterium]|nr:multicopper oxidase domain-containing protein [Ktedonobacteraceae bacterium]